MFVGANTALPTQRSESEMHSNLPIRRCRIVLVDHHPLFLAVLERFMASSPEIEVVGITTSSRRAVSLVALQQPDVAVISVTMPDISGTDISRLLAGKPRAPKIILTALDDDPVYRHAAQAAGASGYVSKLDLGMKLLPMIRSLF
jgi:DNA-binding NarL/FixJ family response regulator